MKILPRSLVKNTAITAVVVILIFLFLYLVKFSGNITGFFRIGDVLPLSPFLNPQDTVIYQGELGYDGQQFLSIAFDPFLQHDGTIAALDHPLYRYRRIFYPFLAYILGLGNSHLIPYVMVGINGFCIIAIAVLCGLYLREREGKIWRSLLVLCIPGCWMVFSLSTSDLLSSLLLIASLYCYQQNKFILTPTFLSLACLTRETVLMVWFAFILVSYWQRNWKQLRYLFLVLIPVFAWNFYVFIRFQDRGTLGTKTNFDYPFFGIFTKIIGFFRNEFTVSTIFEIYLLAILIACFVLIALHSYRKREENRLILGVTLAYGLLFCFSSITILGYYLDFSRVYMDVYFLLLLSGGEGTIAIAPLAASGLASLAFLLVQS
ncbi:MAG: AZOBR_p60025 family cell surface glycopolymer formation protein [Spirulina sp.]